MGYFFCLKLWNLLININVIYFLWYLFISIILCAENEALAAWKKELQPFVSVIYEENILANIYRCFKSLHPSGKDLCLKLLFFFF
jgi:hypothetical protein